MRVIMFCECLQESNGNDCNIAWGNEWNKDGVGGKTVCKGQ